MDWSPPLRLASQGPRNTLERYPPNLMCLQTSLVKSWDSWNWNGDEIIHNPIIPASRRTPNLKKRYPIDIREFLTTADNAVIGQRLAEIVKSLSQADQARFRSRSSGSFDFRADAILRDFRRLRYRRKPSKTGRGPDAWLFPDETLAEGGGDC